MWIEFSDRLVNTDNFDEMYIHRISYNEWSVRFEKKFPRDSDGGRSNYFINEFFDSEVKAKKRFEDINQMLKNKTVWTKSRTSNAK